MNIPHGRANVHVRHHLFNCTQRHTTINRPRPQLMAEVLDAQPLNLGLAERRTLSCLHVPNRPARFGFSNKYPFGPAFSTRRCRMGRSVGCMDTLRGRSFFVEAHEAAAAFGRDERLRAKEIAEV